MVNEEGNGQVWSEERLDRALNNLRADVGTGEGSARRARAQLMLATGGLGEKHDEKEQTMSGDVREMARARSGVDGSGSRSGRRRSPARWLAAAAAVGVLVAGAVTVQALQPGGASAQAAVLLNRSAESVGSAPGPQVGVDEFLYVETHSWGMSTFAMDQDGDGLATGEDPFAFLEERVSEEWIPADRGEEWLENRVNTGNVKWMRGDESVLDRVSPENAASVRKAFVPSTETLRAAGGAYYGDGEAHWHSPTPEFLAGLPRDPQQLFERLELDSADNGHGAAQLLVTASDLLSTGLVPEDLRAALYRALVEVPGLTVTDAAANLDGRTGTALGVDTSSGWGHEIIFDTRTGEFLGQRQTDAAGMVMSFTAVSYGVATEIGVKPTG